MHTTSTGVYMNHQALSSTIQLILTEGKGILAADESFGTIGKRFAKLEIESTPETRRSYRELLFETEGIEQYLSGVILFDETIRQNSKNDIPFPRLLMDKGIVPGIKVDKGTKPLSLFPGELITEGLDGLSQRLNEYRNLGAKFAKWRAVIKINQDLPTQYCIESNAYVLARYASLSQEAEIVPVIEPEVLMDGDHDISVCEKVTSLVLKSVFSQLYNHRVYIEGILLKPNMVLPGKQSSQKTSAQEVAEATVRTLKRVVPAALPGILFLSGGQSPQQATENLNAINGIGDTPWVLSFSFSRALQEPVMNKWKGMDQNRSSAGQVFVHRARCNSAAVMGKYNKSMESQQI